MLSSYLSTLMPRLGGRSLHSPSLRSNLGSGLCRVDRSLEKWSFRLQMILWLRYVSPVYNPAHTWSDRQSRSIPREETRTSSDLMHPTSSLVGLVALVLTLPAGCRRKEPKILSWFRGAVPRLKRRSRLLENLLGKESMSRSVAAMLRTSPALNKTLSRFSLACLLLAVLCSEPWSFV